MYKNDRLNLILKVLKKHKTMTMKELSSQTFSSPSTLRRDIITLEEDNQVTHNFGKVELVKAQNVEFSFPFRNRENETAKKSIAEIASDFIGDNMAIFLDSSTTTAAILPFLIKHQNLVVITNGLFLGMQLNQFCNIKTFMPGGHLRPGSGSLLGESASAYLKNFKADLVFFSCSCLDEHGVYMASEEQSNIKRQMIESADQSILLCDASKFGNSNYYKLSDFSNIHTIITDQQPTPAINDILKEKDIEVLF